MINEKLYNQKRKCHRCHEWFQPFEIEDTRFGGQGISRHCKDCLKIAKLERYYPRAYDTKVE